VPEGQLLTKTRLIRATGLRWPVEEDFRTGLDSLGMDQCQARLYTAIQRYAVLVMAALAICAVTAAQLRDRTDAQTPPVLPGQALPRDPGMIPLTVAEVKRLLAATLARHHPECHAIRWLAWRRRHQVRSRWFHQRTRLNREYTLVNERLPTALLDSTCGYLASRPANRLESSLGEGIPWISGCRM
jgi:hypothetical protein